LNVLAAIFLLFLSKIRVSLLAAIGSHIGARARSSGENADGEGEKAENDYYRKLYMSPEPGESTFY